MQEERLLSIKVIVWCGSFEAEVISWYFFKTVAVTGERYRTAISDFFATGNTNIKC